MKVSSYITCDLYYFFKHIFFGMHPDIIFLLVAFFSLYQVIKINYKQKKMKGENKNAI